MLYRWILCIKKPRNRLWATPALGAILAIFFAFSARLINVWLPNDNLPNIELATLESLLDVIASSMLAVSTFSLSIMVSAFASASSNATPRATELVMGDDNTRMAIASFISAFIYSIIAKTALGMGFYGQNGRFVLFISTALVLVYLIITLIRWVYTLSQLGRMGNTLDKIEQATYTALCHYRSDPKMGAVWEGSWSIRDTAVYAQKSGYLTHINMAALQQYAENMNAYIFIAVRPGNLITPSTLLLRVSGGEDIDQQTLRSHFILSISRTFEQDPGWGLAVLSEAAQRALSPAVNDPGTAVNVMVRIMRLLVNTQPKKNNKSTEVYERLALVPVDGKLWIDQSFTAIARDGASFVEVGEMLQEVLAAIWRYVDEKDISAAAAMMAKQALIRAQETNIFADDLARLEKHHQILFRPSTSVATEKTIQ